MQKWSPFSRPLPARQRSSKCWNLVCGKVLDTFLQRGFIVNAYSGFARQRPHIYCSRKTRQIMKTTFGGIQPSLEDNLWWRTTFGGWRPSLEDELHWKMTFGGIWLLVEDKHRWEMTFIWRRPLVRMTCGGRRPSVEDEKSELAVNTSYYLLHIV